MSTWFDKLSSEVKAYEDGRANNLAKILIGKTEDDDEDRCQCRELTDNSRHIPECDLADNDEYDKVRDEGIA